MATLQGKAVKNTYKQVLQIGANNVGVSSTLQPVQDGGGINTALSLSTTAATVTGDLTITGDLIITGGGIQIQDLIDDTVATLIQNGTGITWAYNDTLRTLTPTVTIATADGGVQGDYLQLNTNANEASAVGKLKWNTTDGTLDIGLMGGQVVLQVGQEQVARVLNNSGSILTEAGYQAVKISSAQGQRLAVTLAQANNEANSTDTLGLVTENIANNQEGFVTTSGLIRQIDTTGDLQSEVWVDGDILYLSPTVPGGVTKVKPLAPQQTVIVGFVVYAHKNNGKIFVKVDNGYELDELHNVRITSVQNNNVLKYNSSLSVWENVAPSTTWVTEGTNLYYTLARFNTAFASKTTTDLTEGSNLYFTETRATNNFDTNLAASTTTDLAEGTNLYFTNQRFDSRLSTKTTTDLAEGSNLYYTQARFNTAFDAKTTTDLDEGTNLYYTDARARAAISENAVGLDYSAGSGVLSLTAGYAIPTTVKLGEYDTAYNRSIVSAGVTGTDSKTLTLTKQDGNTITASWTDQGITAINGTANQIATSTVGNTTTVGFTNDVTFPNNVVVSGNLTINGTATYVNTQSISSKDPLFEVANDNNTTDAVDIGYYGRYYDSAQTRVEFTGLFRDASDAGKFKFFTGLVDEPTNVVDTTGTGYTVGTLVANVEGNLAGIANAANVLSTARTISATGDAAWSVSFDGSANATAALTLANTGVTATTYGTTTAVPTIAVDSKGRITSASNTNIAFPVTTVNSQSGTVVLTTSDIAEGSNQYFTSARAQASITGGASSVVTADLTASRALVSDGTGKIAASSSTTATEVSYLSGVTSAIQTQLNTKAADNAVVHLAGTETITGAKTFSAALNGTSATFSSNVSINSTIQSWGAPFLNSALQLGFSGFIAGRSDSINQLQIGTNAYFNGTNWIYRNTNAASRYYQVDGSHIFSYATSGTAGNPITFVDALTIASTGAATFSSSVTIEGNGSTIRSGNELRFNRADNAIYTRMYDAGSGAANGFILDNTNGEGFHFKNGATTIMRMPSNNNVGIGTSNPGSILDVRGSSPQLRVGVAGGGYVEVSDNQVSAKNSSNAASDLYLNVGGAKTILNRDSGNVLIGTTTDNGGKLQVNGAINATLTSGIAIGSLANRRRLQNDTGLNEISVLGDNDGYYPIAASAFNTRSDYRLKEDLKDIKGLEKISKIRVYDFKWKDSEDRMDGVLAHELSEILPYAVNGQKDAIREDKSIMPQGVDYSKIVPVLVKAIQELASKVEALEAK